MPQHNDVSKRIVLDYRASKEFRYRQRLPLQTKVVIALGLITLACASINPGSSSTSQRIVMLTRLPTFTRTPLPPLNFEAEVTPPAVITSPPSPPSPTGSPSVSIATSPAETGPTQTNDFTANTPEALVENVPTNSPNPPAAAPESQSIQEPVSTGSGIDQTPPLPPSPAILATSLPLPTHTPTSTEFVAEEPTGTPTATATEGPTPTVTPPPTATPLPEGWVFSGAQISSEPEEDGVLLYGEVINNTGSSQELFFISGVFYDAQGQPLPDTATIDYWPIEIVPPGGRVPFELTILEAQTIDTFDLTVEAAPSEDTPSQDFEFLAVNQTNEANNYCLSGQVRNLAGELDFYLTVVAVLYDVQDKVINFSDHYDYSPEQVIGDQTMDFALCVDPLGQDVARYELRAWGL